MNKSILKSTGIVAVSTMTSRVMGLIRDMVISSVFGANALVDGFYVAFRIPNLFQKICCGRVSYDLLCPCLYRISDNKEQGRITRTCSEDGLNTFNFFMCNCRSWYNIFSPDSAYFRLWF